MSRVKVWAFVVRHAGPIGVNVRVKSEDFFDLLISHQDLFQQPVALEFRCELEPSSIELAERNVRIFQLVSLINI